MVKHLNINNSINIETLFGDKCVVKRFDVNRADSLARFSRESAFYQFCLEKKIDHVPKLLDIKPLDRILTLSWFRGKTIQRGDSQIFSRFCTFVETLNKFNTNEPLIENLEPAGESFFSCEELKTLIKNRESNIKREYVEVYLAWEEYENIQGQANELLQIEGLNFGKTIINPSDLGLHNYMQNENDYCFFDFEFAGLDSEAKLLYDFVMHPKNQFDDFTIEEKIKQLTELDCISLEFDKTIFRIFSYWWILRLLYSLRVDVINNREKFGVLTQLSRDNYVQERIKNLDYFKRCFYGE